MWRALKFTDNCWVNILKLHPVYYLACYMCVSVQLTQLNPFDWYILAGFSWWVGLSLRDDGWWREGWHDGFGSKITKTWYIPCQLLDRCLMEMLRKARLCYYCYVIVVLLLCKFLLNHVVTTFLIKYVLTLKGQITSGRCLSRRTCWLFTGACQTWCWHKPGRWKGRLVHMFMHHLLRH